MRGLGSALVIYYSKRNIFYIIVKENKNNRNDNHPVQNVPLLVLKIIVGARGGLRTLFLT